MLVPSNLLRGFPIQQVSAARVCTVDRIVRLTMHYPSRTLLNLVFQIRRTLWSYICCVRSDRTRCPDDIDPLCCSYFLQQNAAIANGTVSGLPINLKYLGVGDGLTVSLLLVLMIGTALFIRSGSSLAISRIHQLCRVEPVSIKIQYYLSKLGSYIFGVGQISPSCVDI